jgi:hypothetical protein
MTRMQNTNRAVRGAVRSRQVCDHCGGPFGMVTHRWWGSKFCKRRCKDTYLREITLGRYTVQRWCGRVAKLWDDRNVATRRNEGFTGIAVVGCACAKADAKVR